MELKQAWNFIGWMADNVPFVIHIFIRFLTQILDVDSSCGHHSTPCTTTLF
jgi:hypothetical protein